MKLPLKEKIGADEWELRTTETADLATHERTIKNTRGSFVACGRALEAIRDGRLYRSLYGTFEEYCQKRWGWGRRYANLLIQGSNFVTDLGTIVPKNVTKPATEGAARAARTARTTATSETGAGPIIELDATGYPVPERAMKYWSRTKEMQDLLDLISAARSAIKKENQEDRIFIEVRLQEVVAILNDAYRQFHQAVPYAVCTTCQGQAPDTCVLCTGRGVISKFRYETCVPSDLKVVRDKATRK